MASAHTTYLPAAGRDWALPLYDPLVKLLGGDAPRGELLDAAALQPGHRVLDVGCGTGTLAIAIKRRHRDVDVTGLDPDPKALARARRKADRAGVSIRLDTGFADRLPYDAASFDRVFSSFMFHHVPAESREPMLREVRRVLKPGGSLHLVDFAASEHGHGGLMARLHSNHHLSDNTEGRMLLLMNRAGFGAVRKVRDGSMLFGLLRLAFYEATART